MAKLSKAEQELLDNMDKQREFAAGRKRGTSKGASMKKRKGKGKLLGPKKRALDLVEEFGLCPISLQPMRRPVLPSSGQAFDEINLVRFCSGGKKRCPVSGAPLDFVRRGAHKGQVTRTPDYALRNVIRHQAAAAKVYIAPIDKDELLRELDAVTDLDAPGEEHATVMPAVAKAVVDDTYLGYIPLGELRELVAVRSDSGGTHGERPGCAAGVFAELVAECLACRAPEIVALGCGFLREEDAWRCGRVLHEALSVGQDPDCRGNVLRVMEAKFEKLQYSAEQARAVLTFHTESVPLQQFQARCAEHVLTNGGTLHQAEAEAVLNLALRVRQDLSGCDSGGSTGYSLWFLALQALRRAGQTLDSASMDRLFARGNRHVLASLAGHPDLLHWHLMKHPSSSLSLCITALADDAGMYEDMNQESMYSDEDEEEFLGSDEDDIDEEDYQAVEQHLGRPQRSMNGDYHLPRVRPSDAGGIPFSRPGSFPQLEPEEPAHSL